MSGRFLGVIKPTSGEWALAVSFLCAVTFAAVTTADAEAAQVGALHVEVGSRTAPVVATVVAGSGELKLTVNGKRVPGEEIGPAGPLRVVAQLSHSDGLRAGVNTISSVVIRGGGGKVRSASRVRLSPALLLADAGDDTGVIATGPSVSVGTGRLESVKASKRWRVIEAPEDAEYTLSGRNEARPALAATTPGIYRLRLKTKPAGGGRTAHDTVTLAASPPDPPIGAPIETQTAGGRIRIGNDLYGGGLLSWVVLDRRTRVVQASGQGDATAAYLEELSKVVDGYTAGDNYQQYMTIISSRGGISSDNLARFGSILKRLGAPLLTPGEVASLTSGAPMSVIGIPGGDRGAATMRIPARSTGGPDGSISGYLQKNAAVLADGTQVYDVMQSGHAQFDTQSSVDASHSTMTVAGKDYTAHFDNGATAGLHLLALNPFTMQVLQNNGPGHLFLPTNTGISTAVDRGHQDDAAFDLRKFISMNDGALVFVQTMGKVKAAGPEWARVVTQIGRIGAGGGNANYVNALDGTTDYAIAGTVGSAQPPIEASTAVNQAPYTAPKPPPARLIGLLSRGRDGRMTPVVAGPASTTDPNVSGVNTDMVLTAYQEPTPWPNLGSPGATTSTSNALATYICKGIDVCKPANSCELRNCYWQAATNVNWATMATQLDKITYEDNADFTAADLAAAKVQLTREFTDVDAVNGYFKVLQDTAGGGVGQDQFNLKRISDDILAKLEKPPSDEKTSNALDLLSKIVRVGSVGPTPVKAISYALSAGFSVGAYLSRDRGGQPNLGPIKAKAQDLGQQIFTRVAAATDQLDTIRQLLVSDSGKLAKAGVQIYDSWKLDPSAVKATRTSMSVASTKWFYSELVPAYYPWLIKGDAANARDLDCLVRDHRWPNQPDDAQMRATVGYDASGNPIKNVLFFARGVGPGASPYANLGRDMFAPLIGPGDNGAGVDRLEFFTPSTFDGLIAHAHDHANSCDVGFMPYVG